MKVVYVVALIRSISRYLNILFLCWLTTTCTCVSIPHMSVLWQFFMAIFLPLFFFGGGPMSQTDSIAIHIPTYTVPIGFVALPTSTYPVNRHNPSPFILLKKNGTVIHMTGTRLLSCNNITHFLFFSFHTRRRGFGAAVRERLLPEMLNMFPEYFMLISSNIHICILYFHIAS